MLSNISKKLRNVNTAYTFNISLYMPIKFLNTDIYQLVFIILTTNSHYTDVKTKTKEVQMT